MKGRVQCRSNLHRKRIVDSPSCTVCGAAHETPDHIIFQCPFAVQFWEAVGLQSSSSLRCSEWHNIQRIRGCPEDQHDAFVILCCWQLWKRRDAFVFRDEQQSMRTFFILCKTEANLWRERMPKRSKKVVDEWLKLLEPPVNEHHL